MTEPEMKQVVAQIADERRFAYMLLQELGGLLPSGTVVKGALDGGDREVSWAEDRASLAAALDRAHAEIDAYDRAIEALHRLAGDTPEARAVVESLDAFINADQADVG